MNIENIKSIKCELMNYTDWYYIETIKDFKILLSELEKEHKYTEFELFNIKRFIGDWVSFKIEYNDEELDWGTFISLKELTKQIHQFNFQLINIQEVINK